MAEIHEDIAAEQAAHEIELRTLDRPTIRTGASTPWGMAQVSRQFDDGIVLHSTASHGGFRLAEKANAAVQALFRNVADRTLRDYYPDACKRVMGVTLNGGQSHARNRQEFEKKHRNEWVVVAALNSDHQPGFVECIARLGGIRCETGDRRFLVLGSDYVIGMHGFVIDPLKHEPYDGPSSFVTWGHGDDCRVH